MTIGDMPGPRRRARPKARPHRSGMRGIRAEPSRSLADRVEGGTDLDRLVFFSDAVFAVAITLLALEIRVPELAEREVEGGLAGAIAGLAPKFLVYAVGFLVVGSYWMAHHRAYKFIRRYDTGLLWLNTVYLLCIAFLPVPTDAVGRYWDRQPAVIFYAVCLAVTGLAGMAMWAYATSGRRLVAEDLDPRVIRYMQLRGLLPVSVALLSIGVSFVSPVASVTLWFLLFFVSAALARIYWAGNRRDHQSA